MASITGNGFRKRQPKPPAKQTELEKALAAETDLTMGVSYQGIGHDQWSQADKWYVTIKSKNAEASFDYHTGLGHRFIIKRREDSWSGKQEDIPVEPAMSDVLNCLMTDATALDESFKNWCDNFGYDVDSRKAERTYFECQELGEKVLRILGRERFERLRYLEH